MRSFPCMRTMRRFKGLQNFNPSASFSLGSRRDQVLYAHQQWHAHEVRIKPDLNVCDFCTRRLCQEKWRMQTSDNLKTLTRRVTTSAYDLDLPSHHATLSLSKYLQNLRPWLTDSLLRDKKLLLRRLGTYCIISVGQEYVRIW